MSFISYAISTSPYRPNSFMRPTSLGVENAGNTDAPTFEPEKGRRSRLSSFINTLVIFLVRR